MPQIEESDIPNLEKFLSSIKVGFSRGEIDPHELKASQKNFIQSKIDRIDGTKAVRAIIMSNDNHVADGHHRWGAMLKEHAAGQSVIPYFMIDLTIDKTIMILKIFEKAKEIAEYRAFTK